MKTGVALVLPLMVALAVLPGCASQLQMVSATQKAAAVQLRAAEDINLERQVFGLCATPLSAAIRNPQIIPGLRALCLPGGGESSPVLLLDLKQPAAPVTIQGK